MTEILESEEWRQATQYRITDDDIERAKLLLGVDIANKHREYIQTASYDAIRNFSVGAGNDNPLGATSSRRG
jgi:hypothetical protein